MATKVIAQDEAVRRALMSLSRYKFVMFGYWAAIWVYLNMQGPKKQPNPFKDFVDLAREKLKVERR